MSQTKRGSLIEAIASLIIGFVINFTANAYILPAFGFVTLTPEKNFTLGLLYTVISVVRSYGVRRLFANIKARWNVADSRHSTENVTHSEQSGSSSTSVFPADAASRNEYPMWDGLMMYFPAALAGVARVSKKGNEQHRPGKPLGWARGISTDHENKILRHLMEGNAEDTDGTIHPDKVAWRALAYAQEAHEQRGAPLAPASV